MFSNKQMSLIRRAIEEGSIPRLGWIYTHTCVNYPNGTKCALPHCGHRILHCHIMYHIENNRFLGLGRECAKNLFLETQGIESVPNQKQFVTAEQAAQRFGNDAVIQAATQALLSHSGQETRCYCDLCTGNMKLIVGRMKLKLEEEEDREVEIQQKALEDEQDRNRELRLKAIQTYIKRFSPIPKYELLSEFNAEKEESFSIKAGEWDFLFEWSRHDKGYHLSMVEHGSYDIAMVDVLDSDFDTCGMGVVDSQRADPPIDCTAFCYEFVDRFNTYFQWSPLVLSVLPLKVISPEDVIS